MTDDRSRTIRAERIYRGGRFESGLVLVVDSSGRIVEVVPGDDGDVRLEGQAIVPGFVNAHSHAFQRGLRGRTGVRGRVEDHFWSWREAMYRLVLELDADGVYAESLRAFREMAATGFTAVGEFHYLHADPEGRPYGERDLLAHRVIEAARDVGLRIALLNVYYARGGLRDEPLGPAQRRFATGDVDAFIERTRGLADAYRDEPAVSIGVAVHSVRAVAPAEMERVFEAAVGEGWPCHVHLSEQPVEVAACRAVHGRTPVELVADLGGLGPGTTGVHCTHIGDSEVELLADMGATVCACPTTEADLGDGFLRALELRRAAVPIALGSDSQARIDPFEEMRAVEYHERLRRGRRNVLSGSGDPDSSVGEELLGMATESGARSLGLEVGSLVPGRWADFVGLDLEHPLLAGWSDETLVEMTALCGDPRLVAGTWVAGERIA